ncbi:unnamed protein product [Trichobilharzia regenti]|nr:unnamed protein product [Trichobilharzia regenti]
MRPSESNFVQEKWRLFIADINRDNYLDKYEFCLASHLAHLFGRRDLSLEDAVIACKPYIRKINKRLAQTQTYGKFLSNDIYAFKLHIPDVIQHYIFHHSYD